MPFVDELTIVTVIQYYTI